jgi:glutaredoxin
MEDEISYDGKSENIETKGCLNSIYDSGRSDFLSYVNEYVYYCGYSVDYHWMNEESKNRISTAISDNDVVVFAKPGCGYCKKAKEQLNYINSNRNDGEQFQIKIIDVKKNTPEGSSLALAILDMLNLSELTFPQIIIKGKYIGGQSDLADHVDNDRIDNIINSNYSILTDNGKIQWEDFTLKLSLEPKILHVPIMKGDGVWYPHWPWYSFQWCMYSNLVRYISIIQLAIMLPSLYLYKTGIDTNINIANTLMIILMIDLSGFVLGGATPWSISGTISTYIFWKYRGNITSAIPYKFVFSAYLFSFIPLYILKKESSLEVALAGYIANSALLAAFRF